MNDKTKNNLSFFENTKAIFKYSDITLAIFVIGILLVFLMPVHVIFMDLLLAVSITVAIVILMTSLFIEKPLDFNVFPTILLVTAILRLSLNIASTRLILADGHKGKHAAGKVIEAFGNFVMEGNIVIGLIVFSIITIINFVVITKGSGRIAEVAARFSLDAMPGKQMAIDADLSAGLIDEETARTRRKALEDESTFFGSMDGANKFVRGDAIAGLLITIINLVAGMIIGIAQRNLSFSQALDTYSALTIGDGLVSQIPALIISLAAGLLVSKSGVNGSTDKAVFGQLSKYPHALWIASILMGIMSIMPGIPTIQFMMVSSITATFAYVIRQMNEATKQQNIQEQDEKNINETESKEESLTDALHIDNIKLELGYNLLSLINYQKGPNLTDQIKALRKQMAKDLGFIIPSVRIHDNMQLDNDEYLVKVKNIECGKGIIKQDKILVMDPEGKEILLPGEKTKEPAFGLPAMWINEEFREDAIFRNYTVVDPPTVITTHLTEIIKDNITDLLSYSETQQLVDEISEKHKKLVSETIPDKISIGSLQRILQNLLSENISIRDLALIIEAVAEATESTKNITLITEFVRARLARQISHSLTSEDGYIPIIVLSSYWEQLFFESLKDGTSGEKQLAMEPSAMQEFMTKTMEVIEKMATQGQTPAILVSPVIRPYVRSVVERFSNATSVISQNEIHIKAKIRTLAQI